MQKVLSLDFGDLQWDLMLGLAHKQNQRDYKDVCPSSTQIVELRP